MPPRGLLKRGIELRERCIDRSVFLVALIARIDCGYYSWLASEKFERLANYLRDHVLPPEVLSELVGSLAAVPPAIRSTLLDPILPDGLAQLRLHGWFAMPAAKRQQRS